MKFLLSILLLVFFLGVSEAARVPNEFLVKYKTTQFDYMGIKSMGLDSLRVRAFLTAKGSEIRHDFKKIGVLHVYKPDSEISIMPVVETDDVDYIEPNQLYHSMESDRRLNIPQVPQDQWGLDYINVLDAWRYTLGNPDLIVGVIDSGVDYNHYALKDNMWTNEKGEHGFNYVDNNPYPMDDNAHGTHCAGVIAANSKKYMGVAPNVKIMALKFLSKEGYGSTSSAIKAIEYGVDNGAKILSNSWGGGGYSRALADSIHYANINGVLFVAAAGNESNNNDRYPSYPASYQIDNVISVGAMDYRYNKAGFSNYGEKRVHVFGPGVSILSTIPNDSGKYMSGTSMAAPFISGASALLMSYFPDLSPKEIKELLVETSVKKVPLSKYSVSGGYISLKNAFSLQGQN